MAINDISGDLSGNITNVFKDQVETGSKSLTEIIGQVKTNSWFAGGGVASYGQDVASMNSTQVSTFRTAVDDYKADVNKILGEMEDKSAIIKGALRGIVADKIQEFFSAVKELSLAYVGSIDQEVSYLIEARNKWIKASTSIAGNLSDDAGKIREQISNIKIDEVAEIDNPTAGGAQ